MHLEGLTPVTCAKFLLMTYDSSIMMDTFAREPHLRSAANITGVNDHLRTGCLGQQGRWDPKAWKRSCWCCWCCLPSRSHCCFVLLVTVAVSKQFHFNLNCIAPPFTNWSKVSACSHGSQTSTLTYEWLPSTCVSETLIVGHVCPWWTSLNSF